MMTKSACSRKSRCSLFLAVLALLSLCLFTSSAFAAAIRVTGRGATSVLARRDAFRQAVEQRVGVLISSRTLTAEHRVIFDRITTSSKGWIDGYTVIADGRDTSGYWATLDVELDDSVLTSAFAKESKNCGLVRVNLSDPRICVRVHGAPWATTTLINALHNAGFSRVSTGMPSPDGFIVNCNLSNVRITRPRSLGFENDFTCSAECTLRVSDGLGDVALQTTFRAASWSTTTDDATIRAQEAALRQASEVFANWLHRRVRTPERHLRAVVYGMGPSDAQRLLEAASGVLHVYVRCILPEKILLELDADCSAVELAMVLEADGRFTANVGGSTLYLLPRKNTQSGKM